MMATIPLEIIYSGILPRLPGKSLMRFKCVSKPWLSLVSSPEFIRLHYALSSSTDHHLILTDNESCLYSIRLDSLECRAVKLPSFGIEPFVVGSCNGLLCVQSYRPYCLVLLNPSTGSYRELPSLLPPRRCSALTFGFGYDCKNDDYKVVRIVDRRSSLGFLGHQIDRIVHVFSLKANSWEVIEWASPQDTVGVDENGTLVNNYLVHWKVWCLLEGKYGIRCFNLCEKQWTRDVPLPDYIVHSSVHHANDVRDAVLDLGVLDGCLYLSTKNQQKSAVDIWIMNEYGMKESWVKLFHIAESMVFRSLRVSPIVYNSLKNQILLRVVVNKTEHMNLWYDIESETAETAEFNGVPECIWIDVCKGSLFNVPGGSQIGTTKERRYAD